MCMLLICAHTRVHDITVNLQMMNIWSYWARGVSLIHDIGLNKAVHDDHVVRDVRLVSDVEHVLLPHLEGNILHCVYCIFRWTHVYHTRLASTEVLCTAFHFARPKHTMPHPTALHFIARHCKASDSTTLHYSMNVCHTRSWTSALPLRSAYFLKWNSPRFPTKPASDWPWYGRTLQI